jgi:hypothetical protein
LRLRRAYDLLVDTRQPISEVALDTGFADGSHFSRRFRTPRQEPVDVSARSRGASAHAPVASGKEGVGFGPAAKARLTHPRSIGINPSEMIMRLRHRFKTASRDSRRGLHRGVASHFRHGPGQYPSKTVRIIVGYSRARRPTVFARIIATAGREVEPVGDRREPRGRGGGHRIGRGGQGHPDGYTLMLNSNRAHAAALAALEGALRHPSRTGPIIQVAQTPNILLVGKELGVANLKEYIALAKKGQLQYASSGRGTPSHITVELFKSMAGIKVEEIPYKSSAQALTDTMSGQVSLNAPGLRRDCRSEVAAHGGARHHRIEARAGRTGRPDARRGRACPATRPTAGMASSRPPRLRR